MRIKQRQLGDYFEGHHIIPRCLGGQGKSSDINHVNIVLLTGREHFLCHWLLHRIYPTNHKISYAFWHMCHTKRSYQKRVKPSARSYQEAKEAISKVLSIKFTGKRLSLEHRKTLNKDRIGIPRSEETKQKISKAQKGRPGTHKGWITVTNGLEEKRIQNIDQCPEGWIRGRKKSSRELISKSQLGLKLSEETKQKISLALKGRSTWNKGLKYTLKDKNG